jgi:N-acetylglucosaminyldiphosphoundecaprenol N-acetyl-beta-D-mannosaminyltransferase
MPIVWMSKLFGPPLRERVTGSDLVPMLAAAAARAYCLPGSAATRAAW